LPLLTARYLATAAAPQTHTPRDRGPRKEGDISSVFASLSSSSGGEATPLPSRFADIKRHLIVAHQDAIVSSFTRLLSSLRSEIEHISTIGSDIIPSIDYDQIHNHSRIQPFSDSLKKRGAAIVRGVVEPDVALGWKEEIKDYIRANPQTKAFPRDNPAVYELYWSQGQVKARAHPNVLATQSFLMSFWHSNNPQALISTKHPVTYADRLRIRQPGDAGFALGAHVDGGSVERWEPEGYGRGGVYNKIWEGKWEELDPWESSCRLPVESDLYNGAGACSMFRMFQGWLSMSNTGPGEGTLLVNPLFKLATAYYLLRPFFSPRNGDTRRSGFLDESNWELDVNQTSLLQGASLGCTQELNAALHPHLDLARSMVHVPQVAPGDYVAWHCDSIHAVDKIHNGERDSSVLYIPACPLTETNARYLVRQREAFLSGTPGPDFPGGVGESGHVGRMEKSNVRDAGGVEGSRAMGLGRWEVEGGSQGVREMVERANSIVV
jgi:hypothetical protein